jgi:hypothetical protein
MTAFLTIPWSSKNSIPLGIEESIEAISNSRRRHVLALVEELDAPRSVGDLAEAIAAIELEKDIPELSAQDRKRVYIALIQVHLDTLDELGAVAYHERSKQVYPTDATAGLTDLVHHLELICDPTGGEAD